MTIYSLYIYDRHCSCVYYQDWHRSKTVKAANEGMMLPGVAYQVLSHNEQTAIGTQRPRSDLSLSSGIVVAVNDEAPAAPAPASTGLPFDEESKLVYGVVLSLRNMIRKLSGKDEQFVNYRTSTYKLHLYETLSGFKFVMLSDPHSDSLRFVLRQIYSGPFLEYVVRNPLMDMDSREHGIDNEYFRMSTDRMVRGLSVFP